MINICYKNSRGASVTLGANTAYRIINLEGFGDVAANVQKQKSPFQDGSSYIDSLLEERFPAIELKINGESPEELAVHRRHIASIFNPKLGEGVLTYRDTTGEKVILAVPEHVPLFPTGSGNQGPTFQICKIRLVCHSPFWLDTVDNLKPLTAWVGKFEFPFEFPVEFGERADRATIVNGGDEMTPIIIEFTGPATNPIVTNETTGERIKVNRVLESGDVLEVNTAFGNKTVEIISPDGSKTNVFNYIDLDSEFFQLVPGENEVSFSSDDADNVGRVLIKYKNRYLGV